MESPGYPFIRINLRASNPNDLKLRATCTSLDTNSPPAIEKNKPSNMSSSLCDVRRKFFHSRKQPQKKASTRKTPKVYIFMNPRSRSTGSIQAQVYKIII